MKIEPNSPAFPLPTFDLTRNEIKYPAHVQGMSKREYAPPMLVKIDASNWEDGEHVIIIDGCPVGGSVSPASGKAIVAWLHTAWAELIEHNTMKHRSSTKSGLIGHNGIFAADMDDLHANHQNTHGGNP